MNPSSTLDLANLLLSLRTPIHFIANPGNAGDSLIACATHQFLSLHKINYIMETNIDADLSGKTVMYAGGGNFGGVNSRVAQYIKKFAFACETFILLPHTLFGAEDLLSSLPASAHIICRERVSYAHANKFCTNAQVYLHDDMVINADVKAFLATPPKNTIVSQVFSELKRRLKGNSNYDFGISLRCVLHYQLFLSKRFCLPIKAVEEGVLNAFRTDVEKTDIQIPSDNVDLSDTYELSSCETQLAFLSTYRFLKHIDMFHTVKTNRLHVAIAAMKLGKQVHLYGNNYFKIKAIYDYSIDGRFENVTWIE